MDIGCIVRRSTLRRAPKVRYGETARWHLRGVDWQLRAECAGRRLPRARAPGRPEDVPGAHISGHNTGSVGIYLIGGHGSSATDDFHQHFTVAQEEALLKLIGDIKTRAAIKRISGHNENAAKACPGFSVLGWYPEAREHFTRAASATRNQA